MFNLGIIAAGTRRLATVMLPTSFVLRRFGAGILHEVRLTRAGVLTTSSINGAIPTATLGPDFWIKATDRTPTVGDGFQVTFSSVTGGSTPAIQPQGTFLLNVDRSFQWQWSGGTGSGQCTMTITPAGQASPAVSTVISFQG